MIFYFLNYKLPIRSTEKIKSLLKTLKIMKELDKKLILYLMNPGSIWSFPKDEKSLASISGVPVETIKDFMKKWYLDKIEWLYKDMDCFLKEVILPDDAPKFVGFIFKKQPYDTQEFNNLVEMICRSDGISYSLELAQKTLENLQEYNKSKRRRISYYRVLQSAIMLARKQLGGPEFVRSITKTSAFRQMLREVDGVSQPSMRVEPYLNTVCDKLPVPDKENFIELCLGAYGELVKFSKTVKSKDPAVTAGALYAYECFKRHLTVDYEKIGDAVGRSNVAISNRTKYIEGKLGQPRLK
jgi:hypothetical protein